MYLKVIIVNTVCVVINKNEVYYITMYIKSTLMFKINLPFFERVSEYYFDVENLRNIFALPILRFFF